MPMCLDGLHPGCGGVPGTQFYPIAPERGDATGDARRELGGDSRRHPERQPAPMPERLVRAGAWAPAPGDGKVTYTGVHAHCRGMGQCLGRPAKGKAPEAKCAWCTGEQPAETQPALNAGVLAPIPRVAVPRVNQITAHRCACTMPGQWWLAAGGGPQEQIPRLAVCGPLARPPENTYGNQCQRRCVRRAANTGHVQKHSETTQREHTGMRLQCRGSGGVSRAADPRTVPRTALPDK